MGLILDKKETADSTDLKSSLKLLDTDTLAEPNQEKSMKKILNNSFMKMDLLPLPLMPTHSNLITQESWTHGAVTQVDLITEFFLLVMDQKTEPHTGSLKTHGDHHGEKMDSSESLEEKEHADLTHSLLLLMLQMLK